MSSYVLSQQNTVFCVCAELFSLRVFTAIRSPVSEDVRRMAHTTAQSTMRDIIDANLNSIRKSGTWKSERIIITKQGASISVSGQTQPVLNFCANNYLGLSVSHGCLLFVLIVIVHYAIRPQYTIK